MNYYKLLHWRRLAKPAEKTNKSLRIWVQLTFAAMFAVAGCGQPLSSTKENEESSISQDGIADSSPPAKPPLTRLFWQDRDSGMVHSADLFQQSEGFLIQTKEISGFPVLSTERNDMVQMAVNAGRLYVGVRDHADGSDESGWIEIDTGVQKEDHGDHSHWYYSSPPTVLSKILDAKQGNPAHVYRYGEKVYIANDKKNGFTQISSERSNGSNANARFFRGGGGHITLAAVGDQIAYSTWIDREGENAGRVDVVDLRGKGATPKYSFRLPTGGIHGAGACGNRVFFAPASGVYWVDCDFDFVLDENQVSIQHLSLDESSEGSEYRTGAFESFRDHLLCIANSKSGNPALCIINGTNPYPKVVRVECDQVEEGMRLSTVRAATLVGKRPFAFAFAEGDASSEKILVFELDPNGDRDFSDAVFHKSIEIGKSKLEGHFGHHGIAFPQDGKIAVISNPGDGTLSILDLKRMEIVESVNVGGQPTHVACYGSSP